MGPMRTCVCRPGGGKGRAAQNQGGAERVRENALQLARAKEENAKHERNMKAFQATAR